MQSPALHLDPKSRFGPCDEARAVAAVIAAARGIEVPMPVVFGRRVIGYAVGQRNSPYVYYAAGFPDLATINSQANAGSRWRQMYSKVSGQQSGLWWDLWTCNGDPAPGTYTGTAFTARQLDDTTVGAMNHGGNVSTATKHMTYFSGCLGTASVCNNVLVLYDRVLTYEACTFNAATLQSMTNTLPALRYNGSGLPGLQITVTGQTTTGLNASTISQLAYTNQAGTTAVALPQNPSPAILASGITAGSVGAQVLCPGDIGNGHCILFLPLAPGDTGVRQIESYTTSATNTGTLAFVLSRPLAYLVMPTNNVQFELDLVYQVFGLTRIYDGACLAFYVYSGNNSSSPVISGRIDTVWA